MEMKFRFISPSSPEYYAERMLRWEILDKSLGLPPNFKHVPEEEKSLHLVAQYGKKIVGCICFLPETQTLGQIFQMAVSDEYQGKSFSRQLIQTLETALIKRGVIDVYLNARVELEKFYHQLGYSAEGDVFVKMGQSFKRMKKCLCQ